MLHYLYKTMFSAYWLVTAAVGLYAKWWRSFGTSVSVLAVRLQWVFFFCMLQLYIKATWSLVAEIMHTKYSFIHAHIQHNFKEKRFSTFFCFQLKCIIPCMSTFWHKVLYLLDTLAHIAWLQVQQPELDPGVWALLQRWKCKWLFMQGLSGEVKHHWVPSPCCWLEPLPTEKSRATALKHQVCSRLCV